MYKAVIFDMDGVIIDSEPLWRSAYRNVFGNIGIHLTDERLKQSKGLRVDEEVVYLCKQYEASDLVPRTIAIKIKDEIKQLIQAEGAVMDGVTNAIELFKSLHMNVALASSSDYSIIQTVLEKLNLHNNFPVIHSAEEEPFGKPHPGVYISTAKKLDVLPQSCLAIEDSYYGVLAAKAAMMGCIAVPEGYPEYDKRFIIADHILDSLQSINRELIMDLP